MSEDTIRTFISLHFTFPPVGHSCHFIGCQIHSPLWLSSCCNHFTNILGIHTTIAVICSGCKWEWCKFLKCECSTTCPQVLIDTIRTGIDVNTLDEITGNAPIHAIVTGKRRSNRTELLLALLVYGRVKVDLPNRRRMPALHLAVEVMDFTVSVLH